MLYKYPSLRKRKKAHKIINRVFIALMILASAALLNGCTNNLYDVNKRINGYKYIADEPGKGYLKTPAQFHADGGGDCEDFVEAKKDAVLALGYKDVRYAIIDKEITTGKAHALLVVNGLALDNMNNYLTPISTVSGISWMSSPIDTPK